jgi:DHA3 family macrolide efflux protein-like MFS transporter
MSTSPAIPAVAAPEPLTMAEVLRVPVMRRLWIGQLISTFGDFLALFAVINFLTYHLHATPAEVTNLQIAYLLPIAILGVLAGVFVDRWPLKPTMVASDISRAALCLLLLVSHEAWQFYSVLAALSVFSSFFGPAQGVAIRSAVPLHGLRSANSLMQQVMFGMRIVGPPLAGVLYIAAGARACYIGDSISFVCSGLLIASLALSKPVAEALKEVTGNAGEPAAPAAASTSAAEKKGLASILPDMRQGISFIVHHAALFFVILALAAGMFIIGCFAPLIAIYIRDTIHGSTKLYSAASAMIGVGMFLGVNILNTAGKKLSNTVLVYAGLIGIALGLCLLAGIPHAWATIVGDLIIGMAVAGIVVPSNTLIQQETPAELMGRVGSSVMSFVFTAQILGLILSGILADKIGVRHVFALCALLLVVLTVAGKLFMEPKHAVPAAG